MRWYLTSSICFQCQLVRLRLPPLTKEVAGVRVLSMPAGAIEACGLGKEGSAEGDFQCQLVRLRRAFRR